MLRTNRISGFVIFLTAAMFFVGCNNNTVASNPVFKVTYSGNGNTGGSVPVDVNAYEQGKIVTVKGNTGNLVKTGNTFAGWTRIADGNGKIYSLSTDTLVMGNANLALSAKWTPRVATELEGIYTGRVLRSSDVTRWTYNFTLDSIYVSAGDAEIYSGTFTLNTTVNPKTIDIRIGASSKPDYVGKIFLGLYTFDSGNVLEMTADEPGTPRPATMNNATKVLGLTQ